jgi:hypothetical protein
MLGEPQIWIIRFGKRASLSQPGVKPRVLGLSAFALGLVDTVHINTYTGLVISVKLRADLHKIRIQK